MRIAWKLFNVRKKTQTLGPLFINRRQVIERGVWYEAECHPTKGYFVRPGWHCAAAPNAPHLTTKGRLWLPVVIVDYQGHHRPDYQGGLWFTANKMLVLPDRP